MNGATSHYRPRDTRYRRSPQPVIQTRGHDRGAPGISVVRFISKHSPTRESTHPSCLAQISNSTPISMICPPGILKYAPGRWAL